MVLIPFVSFSVELVPAFKKSTGYATKYSICLTKGGGSDKDFDPNAEITHIQTSNTSSKGNTRDLIRMMKCWQNNCTVPMKSFWLELLAEKFLKTWNYCGYSTGYYDFMTRDFFAYILTQVNTHLVAPGTYDVMYLGNAWQSKADSGYSRAKKACELEGQSKTYDAGVEWQKIYGTMIPLQ